MLSETQILEIRDWLNRAQNPVFFFDNDVDGLISFLLLQRFIGRGKGVPIKSFPDLNSTYARKIEELKPDIIFILDKPMVAPEFLEDARMKNIPIVWIDHHPLQNIKTEGVYYYNPLAGKHISSEPVSYWCYKITKQDEWIAFIGCISDWFIPDFTDEIREKYSDLLDNKKEASEVLYETQFGKIVNILLFALKDSTTNVIKMLKVLVKAQDPYGLLSGEKKYEPIIHRYEQLNKKFEKLFENADEIAKKSKKLIFFQYSGEMKLSSELSNKLLYKYPDKLTIVANIQGDRANLSLRGPRARMYLEKALEKVEGRGGGHEVACAATVREEDLKKFVSEIEGQI